MFGLIITTNDVIYEVLQRHENWRTYQNKDPKKSHKQRKIFKFHPQIIFFINGDFTVQLLSFFLFFLPSSLPSLPDDEIKRLFFVHKSVLFVRFLCLHSEHSLALYLCLYFVYYITLMPLAYKLMQNSSEVQTNKPLH